MRLEWTPFLAASLAKSRAAAAAALSLADPEGERIVRVGAALLS